MSEVRILVVEDEADQRHLVATILRSQKYLVATAESLAEARAELGRSPVDLVLADWKLPDGDGMELLRDLRERGLCNHGLIPPRSPLMTRGDAPAHPNHGSRVAFIMVTAYGTIARAVEAIRRGADDYLAKPFERQALLLALDKALRSRRLEDENRRLAAALGERDRLVDLVGSAPSMQRLFRQVEKLATTDAIVLLTGESGTGKELAARALHALSRRAEREFVAVNCAAIPDGLMESEFFGVEKGAFTGADRTRAGNFEAADGGTLFLDEVGELPLAIQPKLLRVLQEGRVVRVGGTREIATDVRIIAATNRDLGADVASGRFREDLYYRLHVVPLRMPPLRERREDVSRLVEHFAARAARRHNVRVRPFPPQVLKRLLDYGWPGNVRELGNVVERLVLLADDGRVTLDDLPEEMTRAPQAAGDFRLPAGGFSWEAHERGCLQQALELAAGNRARAARLLGLPYKAFLYRLEKYSLGDA